MIDIKAGGKNLMNLSVTTSPTKTVPKLIYDVLIENERFTHCSNYIVNEWDLSYSQLQRF